jgi:thiamine pyrophosphate-dependent acetolactate synthase large subunit-like protein
VVDGNRYVSDAIVELLAALDCRYIPLNPGSSFRGLHESLVNYEVGSGTRPEVILMPHEEMCVAASHAYAKATGEVGWAVVHNLVGLMHATMAVYNAWCDGVPMVILGGGGPLEPSKRRAIDWLHTANVQSSFVRSIVKYDDDPVEAQSTLDSIAQAWHLAGSAPRKPTYVTVDSGVQEQLVPDDLRLPDPQQFAAEPPFVSRDSEVAKAADLLWNAQNPVVIGGQVSYRKDATPLIVDIVELLGAGYRDERNMVAFPTAHPQNLSGDEEIVGEADCMLTVDTQDLNWETAGPKTLPGGFRSPRSFDGTIVDISNAAFTLSSWSNAGKAPRPVDLRLQGDPLEVMAQLRAALRERERAASSGERDARDRRIERIASRHRALRGRQAEAVEEAWDSDPISAARMVGELWAAVRDHDWLLLMRNLRSWPEGLWEFSGCGEYLGHSGGGGVGYGPGALLGGALAARDRGQLAVGIIGDGDFFMGPGVLWSAVHYRVPMLVVVNNNRSYYQDERHQATVAGKRGRAVERAHVGTRIHHPEVDFGALARSCGAWAPDPVVGPEQLKPAFEEGVDRAARGQVALVDVRTRTE